MRAGTQRRPQRRRGLPGERRPAFARRRLRTTDQEIDGLRDRLVHLSYGLAVTPGFIGVELVIHALHTDELPFVNGGEPVTLVPEVPISVLLTVILATLAGTTIATLARVRRDRREHVAADVSEDLAGDVSASDGDPAGTVSAASPGSCDT